MSVPYILASGSETRAKLLRNAGLEVTIQKPLVDEETIKQSLIRDELSPRNIADALAEAKARKVSSKFPDAVVIAADQVLDFKGALLSKPKSQQELKDQLGELSAQSHTLHTAACVYNETKPIWRHVSKATLRMRGLSKDYIDSYIERNWEEVRHCVGGYMLEAEGARLFSQVQGDFFAILGLPLVELLSFLTMRGDLEG